MTSTPERSAPPERPEPASSRTGGPRRSIVSYLLRLLGVSRPAGQMGPSSFEPAPPAPPDVLPLGGSPHASDEERRRRGEAFGTTHGHHAA